MAFNVVETPRTGAAAIREIQSISIGSACTGTWVLSGQTINAADSVANVQAAIDAANGVTAQPVISETVVGSFPADWSVPGSLPYNVQNSSSEFRRTSADLFAAIGETITLTMTVKDNVGSGSGLLGQIDVYLEQTASSTNGSIIASAALAGAASGSNTLSWVVPYAADTGSSYRIVVTEPNDVYAQVELLDITTLGSSVPAIVVSGTPDDYTFKWQAYGDQADLIIDTSGLTCAIATSAVDANPLVIAADLPHIEELPVAILGGASSSNRYPSIGLDSYISLTMLPPSFQPDVHYPVLGEAVTAGAYIWLNPATSMAYLADNTLDQPVFGFVATDGSAGASHPVYVAGQNTALAGLVAGETQYLSTAGTVTAVEPVSGLVQSVGEALSATVAEFDRGRVIYI